MTDIVALGELLIDFTPGGENSQGIALFARNPGGAPANVLAMAAKLGASAALIGKVGDDAFGAYLKGVLEGSGIDSNALVMDAAVPTTLAFVQLDSRGERSFSFYRKPGADMMLSADDVDKKLIEGCKIFHFGSVSMTDEPVRSATLEAAAYAREKGRIVSFDPNYRPLLWSDEQRAREQMLRGVKLCHILKVSHEEMTLLTGETSLEAGAEKLVALGPVLVLVSLGEEGAFYRCGGKSGLLPAYTVDTVDTTGAGDAFVGAMLWQLKDKSLGDIESMELESLVAFANAAGGLTTTKFGAIPALPELEEVENCMKKAE